MTRRGTKAQPLDPRVDDILLRHVRLVKPHLAARGFKLDKWATIAAAVNREVGRKVWSAGNGAQGRYGHLLAHYHDGTRELPTKLRQRIEDYLHLLEIRTAQDQRREYSEEEDDEEEEEDEEEQGVGRPSQNAPPDQGEEDEVEQDEYVEEVDFKREQGNQPVAIDLTADAGARGTLTRLQAAAGAGIAPTGTSAALFHDTVSALRDMAGGLLRVIEQDHAARHEELQRNREDRKELLEVVRLALQPRD